ncbi:MAG: hypothetical protein U0934_17580 [Pseudotabrizicola sp.]|uniref:hypothetical protein n=1 Tax=Pseudotabrizicola sp. TaxID=2939647 RepID=UPI00271EFDA1|nr:hypothetical protein [Pseudotabrizicola sp.]MDO8884555.1 hypothetical protein [Pseudotabrizicola sp.]MDP2081533.1 hypothetical protein [Pseudotabrizicola sp.]MDZ7575736.1 hypothetical protein [Pseudotabrizicola sp.]
MKNRDVLGAQGIVVPGPARYRSLLRDTAITLKGQPASRDTQALVLEQIMEEDRAERLILSWDNFLSFPQWVLKERLYPAAAERVRAFTQIFPEIEAEFHLAIRNPATFLPELFAKQRDKSFDQFMDGIDPMDLHWSEVIEDVLSNNPDVPFTVWCDEDTPLIWPEVLQAVSGHAEATPLIDTDELLAMIMSPEGLVRMNAYIDSHPVATATQRRRIVSAFLDKFALPERVELELDVPGWTEDTVTSLTHAYQQDIARIRAMPGVTFISA